MTEIQVRPKADKRIAWQYTNKPWGDWPEWVKNCCNPVFGGTIMLNRKSGKQQVLPTDWLIKDLDGGISWCSDTDMWKIWEKV